MKRKLEQRAHRQRKRQINSTPTTGSPAYKSKSTEAKATNKAERHFPKSPRKKKAVFKNLAVKLFPGETIFQKKMQKNPSVLTDNVKAMLEDCIITQSKYEGQTYNM